MGQLSSVLSTINTVTRAVNTARDLSGATDSARLNDLRAQQGLALDQLRARQTLEESAAQQKRDRDLKLLEAQNASDERKRLETLRTTTGRTRASLGGAGVGSADGSGANAINNLLLRSEEDRNDRENIRAIRERIINETFDATHNQNLLELSQFTARQNLRRQLI